MLKGATPGRVLGIVVDGATETSTAAYQQL